MNIRNPFENMVKVRFMWIVYIPLSILATVLLMLTFLCLAHLVIGIAIFTIPFLFGLRDIKKFIAVGIIVILAAGIIFGLILTSFMYNREYIFEPGGLSAKDLKEGMVTPYEGNITTRFNYTIRYTGAQSPGNITIFAVITDYANEYKVRLQLEYSEGIYYNSSYLGDRIYFYYFESQINGTDDWIRTDDVFGPITIGFSEMVQNQMFIGTGDLILNGGLLYFMILGLYYWHKKTYAEEDKEKNGDEKDNEVEDDNKVEEEDEVEDDEEVEEGEEEKDEEEDSKKDS